MGIGLDLGADSSGFVSRRALGWLGYRFVCWVERGHFLQGSLLRAIDRELSEPTQGLVAWDSTEWVFAAGPEPAIGTMTGTPTASVGVAPEWLELDSDSATPPRR